MKSEKRMEGGKKKSAAYGSQCLYSAWLLLSYMGAAAVVEESEREREERGEKVGGRPSARNR